jgi:hypothetical protein
MSLWHFHEAYKALDVKSVYRYPNKCPMNWLYGIPKFDSDPSTAVTHVTEFTNYIFGIEHEDVVVRFFFLSLKGKQRDWIKHSCKPKSISDSTILICEFLKHWGPKNQELEDTI